MKYISNSGFKIRSSENKKMEIVIDYKGAESVCEGQIVIYTGGNGVSLQTKNSFVQLINGVIEISPLDADCLVYDTDEGTITDGYISEEQPK